MNEECSLHGIAIGQCGCAGGGRVAVGAGPYTAGALMATPFPTMPMPGAEANAALLRAQRAQAAADAAAAEAAAAAAAAGDWTQGMKPNPGCYPRGMQGNLNAFGQMLTGQSWRPEPYQDSNYDFCNMDSLYSDIVLALPGVPISLEVAPNQGTFGAFYWDIVAIDDATGVEVSNWRIEQPAVRNCPTPCDVNGPILGQFAATTPDACCGKPIRAFLDEESKNAPLEVTFTNGQAAGNMRVQVRVRGYCCSTKVCW